MNIIKSKVEVIVVAGSKFKGYEGRVKLEQKVAHYDESGRLKENTRELWANIPFVEGTTDLPTKEQAQEIFGSGTLQGTTSLDLIIAEDQSYHASKNHNKYVEDQMTSRTYQHHPIYEAYAFNEDGNAEDVSTA